MVVSETANPHLPDLKGQPLIGKKGFHGNMGRHGNIQPVKHVPPSAAPLDE
jgi:hypothetical protein